MYLGYFSQRLPLLGVNILMSGMLLNLLRSCSIYCEELHTSV